MYMPEVAEKRNCLPISPLDGALEMVALGFSVFPLRPGTKDGFYSNRSWKAVATNDPERVKTLAARYHGCNWGVRCSGHVVLDVDVADGKCGEAQLLKLELAHDLPPTRTHASARGGQHVIYKLPSGVEVSNRRGSGIGNAVDVRGAGGYIVCPGSTFEGRPYSVLSAEPVAEAPPSLVELLRAPDATQGEPFPQAPAAFNADRARSALEVLPKTREACTGEDGARVWRDLWLDAGMAMHHASGGSAEGYDAWHGWSKACEGYEGESDCRTRWASFGKRAGKPLTLATLEARARRYGWLPPGEFDDVSAFAAELEEAGRGEWNPPARDSRGRVQKSAFENLVYWLDYEGGTFWLNGFTGELQVEGFKFLPNGRVDDATWVALRNRARERGLNPPDSVLDDTCRERGRKAARHPVREYLASLKWDGVSRVGSLFTAYAGAEDSPVNRAAAVLLMVAAVRRVKQPGCKFDYLVVLEGQQGCGKSSLVRILAGRFYGDGLSLGLDDRSLLEQTRGKWLIEVPELTGMNTPRGQEHVKAMVTRQTDRARQAYAREVSEVHRQWVGIATTNERHYLTDKTGNRRFLPVAVNTLDHAALKRDRDQLWAEAVFLERAYGDRLVMPEGLAEAVSAIQESRERLDPIYEALRELFDGRHGYVLSADVFRVAERVVTRGLGNADREAAAAAMRRMGFTQARLPSGTKPSVYLRWGGSPSTAPEIKIGSTGLTLVVDNDAAAAERRIHDMLS